MSYFRLKSSFLLGLLFLCCSIVAKAQSPTPVFEIVDTNTSGGDSIQVDVKVANFDSLFSFDFTIIWDESILEFSSIGNLNLAHMDAAIGLTNVESGVIFVGWFDTDATTETVDDETVIFSIFFKTDCDIGNTTEITFSPTDTQEASNGKMPNEIFSPPVLIPATITFTPGVSITSTVATDLTCNGEDDGCASVAVTNGSTPYTYEWSNGGTSAEICNLPPGNYTCTVTDEKGCTAISSTVEVMGVDLLDICNNTLTNPTCTNGDNGCIEVEVCGGTAFYTYAWSNGGTTAEICNLSAGSYTCTVTDANGCTDTGTFEVNDPVDPLTLDDAETEDVSCSSAGSINLTLSGGNSPLSYEWSDGATTEDINDLPVGEYACTITDDEGCSIITPTYSITSTNTDLVVSNASTSIGCFGENTGSIDLSVTGSNNPFTYLWSTNETSQDLDNLSAGTYSCTVTDSEGCTTVSANITIEQPESALTVATNASVDVLCQGDATGSATVTAEGGTDPYEYLWNSGEMTSTITNKLAGNYTCTITDANGCTAISATLEISEPSSTVGFINSVTTDLSCSGSDDGSVSLEGNGGVGPYTYLWNEGSETPNISDLEEGPYQCTITDNNGCTFVTNAFIIESPEPVELDGFEITNADCANGGSINLEISGGSGPYNYEWSDGSEEAALTDVNAGNYQCTVTDNMGCSLITQSFTVILEDSDLNLDAFSTTDILCFGDANGSISLAISGTATPFTYEWSNDAETQNISDLSPGDYSCTITDINGCSVVSGAINISQPDEELTIAAVETENLSCANANDGTISLEISGGTMPYSYNWILGQNSATVENLSVGNYSCTITDDNGCTVVTNTISITGPTAITITSEQLENTTCGQTETGSIDISVAGGEEPYSFLWNTGDVSQNLNNISAGNYVCTITDNTGCTLVTEEYTIDNEGSDLAIAATTVTPIECFGESTGAIDLQVSGTATPFTFEWSSGANTQNISALPVGFYSCTITDANDCSTTSSTIEITQPAMALSISNSTSTNVNCAGDGDGAITLQIAGGTEPYTYLWNNGAITNNLDDLMPGLYSCIITDAAGCTLSSSEFSIVQPDPLVLESFSTEDVICGQGNTGSINILISGGIPPLSYEWSNGSSNQNLTDLAPGNYTCSITDNNDCTLITEIITIEDEGSDLEILTEAIGEVTCFGGSDGSISFEVSGSATPLTYEWSNGANTANIDGLTAGTYTCMVTDANGCIISSSAIVVPQPTQGLMLTDSEISNSSCSMEASGNISITIGGGTMPYSYNWSNGGSGSALSDLPAGEYTCTITDFNNCNFVVGPLLISAPTMMSVASQNTGNASCSEGGFIEIEIDGGTAPYSYAWNSGMNTQNIFNIGAGEYICTVTDAEGCTFTTTPIVIGTDGTDLNWVSTERQTIACFGGDDGTIDITIAGTATPFTYAWNNGADTEDLENLSPGLYSCTITDTEGCSITLSNIALTGPAEALSETDPSSSNPSCFGLTDGSILIGISGGVTPYEYMWNNGNDNNNILTNIGAGDYNCTITDANGCTFVSSTITLTEPPTITLESESIVDEMDGDNTGIISITTSGGTQPVTYMWSTGADTPTIENLSAGDYTCTITDANGCTSEFGPFEVGNLVATVDLAEANLSIYPNPVQQVVNLESGYKVSSVRILDVQGRTHIQQAIEDFKSQLSVAELPVGIYLMKIQLENGMEAYHKLVKVE
ncbi:MAG: T9SS type A sorting domain-containing protein [Saprospiraceae bacterium]